jgi:hypothetical protein
LKQKNSNDNPVVDWVITIPQTVKWEDYQKELNHVSDGSYVMNYRVPFKPNVNAGDRCFIVWRGRIRGWMKIVSCVKLNDFTCDTTGQTWYKGWFIQRSGKFHTVDGPDMKGFRGIRRYKEGGIPS